MSRVGGSRIGQATAREGSPIYLPRGGVYGGGKYGEKITDKVRTFAILREPVAHRVVATVAKDIFNPWFTLELEGAKEEDNKAFDKAIQKELRRLRAKRELTLMGTMERGYGYGIIALGFIDSGNKLSDPLEKPTRLVDIKAYGTPQLAKPQLDKNEKLPDGKPNPHYMQPEIYSIKRKGIQGRLKMHFSRVIHWATRYLDPQKPEWQGQSVLDDIYDDVLTLRNIRWSMGQTFFRYGSGFPVFTFDKATKAQLQAWQDAGLFGDISGRTYFVQNEKQKIEFKGLQGRALNPEPYVKGVLESISCGTGIPMAILRGAQAGALTGSEVNQMEYYSIIGDEQGMYEPGMRKLIDIIRLFAVQKQKEPTINKAAMQKAIIAVATDVQLPKEVDLPGFDFKWKGGFELDEEKKQRIATARATELQIRGQWHTRNQIRKMEDPEAEDLPEGCDGNKVLGAPSVDVNQMPGSAYRVIQNPDGTTTVIDQPKRRTES